jgi:uncharacterized protein YlzI (FlbEa/FlbD family)
VITLTRLNGEEIMLNPFQVESIDQVPDTQIAMANGRKIFVTETPKEVRERFRLFLRSVRDGPEEVS